MRLYTALFLFVLTLATALAQKPVNVVGTWAADQKAIQSSSMKAMAKSIEITFNANGSFKFKGFNTRGEGTYAIEGSQITISASKRNGVKPPTDKEKYGKLTIGDNGKKLYIETGQIGRAHV